MNGLLQVSDCRSEQGRGKGWNRHLDMSVNAYNALDDGQLPMTEWLAWIKTKGIRLSTAQAYAVGFKGEWHHIRKGAKRLKVRFAEIDVCPQFGENTEEALAEIKLRASCLLRHPDWEHPLFGKGPNRGWYIDYDKYTKLKNPHTPVHICGDPNSPCDMDCMANAYTAERKTV